MELGEVTGVAAIEIEKESRARAGAQLALCKECLFFGGAVWQVAPRFAQVRWMNVGARRCGMLNRFLRGGIGGCLRHGGCLCIFDLESSYCRRSSERALVQR